MNKGIEFIFVKDARNDKVYFDNCKFISQEEHNKLIKRCHPERGDLLVTKSGIIGRTAIVNTDEEFSLFVSVALIKSIKEQEKIVSDIESKFLVIDNVEQIVNQSLIKSEQLKKSILKVAFEGRLVKES